MKGAAIGAHTLGGFSTSVDANTTCTGDFLAGYFNIQGAADVTSSNHVNVLEATKTGAGAGVVNVGHFTMNGTGATITNILKAENIVGTTTSLLDLTRTAGTVTNGIKLSGTMTKDIVLQNAESIDNATDGVTNFGNTNMRGATWNFADATAVGGTATAAIEIDFTPNLPALQAGLMIMFVAEGINTTTLTVAIDGGTAKNIFEQEPGVAPNALDGGEIQVGTLVMAVYDGTQWVLISPTGNH
jgi:hypothetical protein